MNSNVVDHVRLAEATKKLGIKYYHDPVGFIEAVFHDELKDRNVELSEQQKTIANSLVKYRKVSTKSGHHIGKDMLAAGLIWWFLTTRKEPKIICSANTKEQLYDVLWAECAKWKRNSKLMDLLFVWQKDKIFAPWNPAEWWAVARTASKGEGIQGRHTKNMLLILDEVSGMDDSILEASEGLMSGENIYVLLISNPTRDTGFFYDTQTNPALKDYWHPITCSSLDSPHPSKKWLEYMLAKYGVDSPVYQVRVLGEFPTDLKSALIPRSWIHAAMEREAVIDENAPRVLAVDVGAGGDKSVIVHRVGNVVDRIVKLHTPNTMDLYWAVCDEWLDYKADVICVDYIGVGTHLYWHLNNNKNFTVHAVDVRKKSHLPEFRNLRDELYWSLREDFELGGISIPKDDDLELELRSLKYGPKPGNKTEIWNKEKIKKDIKQSPDVADALMISKYIDDRVYYKSEHYDDEDESREQEYYGRSAVTGY